MKVDEMFLRDVASDRSQSLHMEKTTLTDLKLKPIFTPKLPTSVGGKIETLSPSCRGTNE